MVYLAVEPQPALRQGLFAKGRIATDARTVLAVPLSAVRADLALPYVIQVLDQKAQYRSVRLGQRGEVDGQPWVEVVDGVTDGASVLAGTTGLVRDGTPVRLAAGPVAPAGAAGPAAMAAPSR
jgi:hypothetical protein